MQKVSCCNARVKKVLPETDHSSTHSFKVNLKPLKRVKSDFTTELQRGFDPQVSYAPWDPQESLGPACMGRARFLLPWTKVLSHGPRSCVFTPRINDSVTKELLDEGVP